MSEFLTLAHFIYLSHELGGLKRPVTEVCMYHAAVFEKQADAAAFFSIMQEAYPFEAMFQATIDGKHAVQLKGGGWK